MQLNQANQAERFCSALQLKPKEKACVSAVKITADSQGAIVRACLDKSLWPDHCTPSMELLYRAYVAVVQLVDDEDFCLMAEDVGDEYAISQYKKLAQDMLKTLHFEYQKLTKSMFSRFNATAIAIKHI